MGRLLRDKANLPRWDEFIVGFVYEVVPGGDRVEVGPVIPIFIYYYCNFSRNVYHMFRAVCEMLWDLDHPITSKRMKWLNGV